MVSFLDGILFEKFENISSADVTGVDTDHYSNSFA
jgi:hypothetical protein